MFGTPTADHCRVERVYNENYLWVHSIVLSVACLCLHVLMLCRAKNKNWHCELSDTENLLVHALNSYCSKPNSIGIFFGPLNFKHRVMSDKRKLKLTMRTIWHRKPTRACFKLVLFKAKIHSEYFSVPWSKHRVMSDERKLKLTLKTLWHPKSTSSCRFRWRFRRR